MGGRSLLPTLALLLALPASAATKIGAWTAKTGERWFAEYPKPENWIEERASIRLQLLAVHERLGTGKAIANGNFAGWMRHLKWLSLFPENWEEHEFFKEADARDAFTGLASEALVQNGFLVVLSPYDDHARALEILCRLYRAHPEEVRSFPALAIALAVVFDQPFPAGWPHHFVDPDAVGRVDERPEDRFKFFVDSQAAGALMYNLKRLTSQELKFVVDTPLSLRELRYVQGVKMRSIKQFHDLFQLIPYDRPRLAREAYVWPHGNYELPAIAKHGGLCVDQAYYTSHAAKAKGVPNIVFLGQGNSGEHAWIGYLESYSRWRFDLAKFRNEDYPVGQAFDPQTWRRLTDSECQFLNRRSTTTTTYRTARHAVMWAALNPGAAFEVEALRLARKTAPEYIWAWEREAALLEETKAGPEELARFWSDWISAFRDQKDLRFRGEKRLLVLLEDAGRTVEYNRLLSQVISANKNQRFDLVVGVAAEKVFVHVENKRWEDAHKTFRAAMTKLATKAGGHLFYQLVQPYVQSCLEEGQIKHAEEALERALRAFEANPGSILDKDIKELAALVKAKAR